MRRHVDPISMDEIALALPLSADHSSQRVEKILGLRYEAVLGVWEHTNDTGNSKDGVGTDTKAFLVSLGLMYFSCRDSPTSRALTNTRVRLGL